MGKNLVFMPECHSTNTYALQLCQQKQSLEGTVVITNNQTAGRGQRGNTWEAEPGTNLTFSIILKPTFMLATEQFMLNRAVSLGIANFLRSQLPKAVRIKWPNDMLVQEKKICGVLIENVIQGSAISASVVGIGLNVNQHRFSIERATSLHLETGILYDLSIMLDELLHCIETYWLMLRERHYEALNEQYLEQLFAKDEPRQFRTGTEIFEGTITGVDVVGRLIINTSAGERVFGMKEVEFVFRDVNG